MSDSYDPDLEINLDINSTGIDNIDRIAEGIRKYTEAINKAARASENFNSVQKRMVIDPSQRQPLAGITSYNQSMPVINPYKHQPNSVINPYSYQPNSVINPYSYQQGVVLGNKPIGVSPELLSRLNAPSLSHTRMGSTVYYDNPAFSTISRPVQTPLSARMSYSQSQQKNVGYQEKGALSNSWDAIYNKELSIIQDPKKRNMFLQMMDETTPESIKTAPASESGKYHPSWANTKGGLAKHSKAVAQAALGIAGLEDYQGNRDDLIIAALGHDAQKLGADGRHYKPLHAGLAAAEFKTYGLNEAASMVETHMGDDRVGAPKGSIFPETHAQKLLSQADWLISRKYNEDLTTWDVGGKNIESMDVDAMRSRAVEQGEAKFNTDGSFEILGNVADKEEEAAKAAKARSDSWHSTLGSASKFLGLMAQIGKLAIANIVVGGVVLSKASDKVSIGMPTLTGMSDEQIYGNALAGKIIGNSGIGAEITDLAYSRGQFHLTGENKDLLGLAQSEQLSNLLLGDTPVNTAYWNAADVFASSARKAKQEGRQGDVEKIITLARTTLGSAGAQAVDYAVDNKLVPSSLTKRDSLDPNVLGDIQSISREFQIQMDGIKTSFGSLYAGFIDSFGNPVMTWFNHALQDIISGRSLNDKVTNRLKSKSVDVALGAYGLATTYGERESLWRNSPEGKALMDAQDGAKSIRKGGVYGYDSLSTANKNKRIAADIRTQLKNAGYGREVDSIADKDIQAFAISEQRKKIRSFDEKDVDYGFLSGENDKKATTRAIRQLGIEYENKKTSADEKAFLDFITSGPMMKYNDPAGYGDVDRAAANAVREIIQDTYEFPNKAGENLQLLKELSSDKMVININNNIPQGSSATDIFKMNGTQISEALALNYSGYVG